MVVDSYEREEYLLFSGFDDDGAPARSGDDGEAFRLRWPSGRMDERLPNSVIGALTAGSERHAKAAVSRSLEQNSAHFNQAREKLEKWADDMVLSAEKALDDTKEQIKVLRREARQATTLEEQHAIQEKIAEAGAPAASPAAGDLQGRRRDHGEARRADRLAGEAPCAATPRPRRCSPFAGRSSDRCTPEGMTNEQKLRS